MGEMLGDETDRVHMVQEAARFIQCVRGLEWYAWQRRDEVPASFGGVDLLMPPHAISVACPSITPDGAGPRIATGLTEAVCLDPENHRFAFYTCGAGGFAGPPDAPLTSHRAYFEERTLISRRQDMPIHLLPESYSRIFAELTPGGVCCVFANRFSVPLRDDIGTPVYVTAQNSATVIGPDRRRRIYATHVRQSLLGAGWDFMRMDRIARTIQRASASRQ